MKKKTLKCFIYFMIFMFVMTIVSRGVYAYKLPKVTTDYPQTISLDHSIKGEGSVKESKKEAVVVLSGIRVSEVYVKEGDVIKEGTVLFKLDDNDLKEQIQLLQNDVTAAKLQLSDLRVNEDLAATDKQKKIDRAAADYNSTVATFDRQVSEAAQDVTDAENDKNALKSKDSYIEDAVSGSSDIASVKSNINDLQQKKTQQETDLSNLDPTDADFSSKKDKIDSDIADLEQKISEAKDSLDSITESVKDTAADEWETKSDALSDAVTSAKRKYDSSVDSRSNSVKTASRGIEDSKSPDKQDSSSKISQMALDEKEAELKKYKEFQSAGTQIKSTKKGVISEVFVEPGGKTPDTASILFADMSGKLTFGANISKENQKRVSIGDMVSLSFHNGKDKEDAVLSKMELDDSDTTKYNIEITMENPVATIGEAGEFEIRIISQNKYLTVPLTAIHSDGLRYYVYVLEKRESFLGQELKICMRNVVINDKNDRLAAIENSGLTDEDTIIISSNKDIADGSIVRLLSE